MNKTVKGILVIMIVATVMFSMVLATSYAVTPTKDKTDVNSAKILSKAKTLTNKITWNANAGKIGTKKTTSKNLKKDNKIGKLPTTPKRNGYTFKGWYTKKNGGTKITKNTVPNKSITYYAQWTKASTSVNSNIDSKLIGVWKYEDPGTKGRSFIYAFFKNGTVRYFAKASMYSGTVWEGKFYTANGKIYLNNMHDYSGTKWENKVVEYKFGTDVRGNYLTADILSPYDSYYKNNPYLKFR